MRWTIFSVNCTATQTGEWLHTIPESHFVICAYGTDTPCSDDGWYIRDLWDAEHYPDWVALPLPRGLGAIVASVSGFTSGHFSDFCGNRL